MEGGRWPGEKKSAGVLFLPLFWKKEPCRRLTYLLGIKYHILLHAFPPTPPLNPFHREI